MAVNVEIIRNIVEVETFNLLREEDTQQQTVKSDDYQIKDDPDGYRELPTCLDRRKPRLREAA
jgi:hypothetical protein